MTSVPAAPADTEGSDTGAWLWPLLFLAAYAAVLAWKQQAFAGVVPLGDHAADDLLIVDAKRLALLHGVYSRLGFYHPGPLVLQISALGELILFDALRWFSSYYLAQVFVTALLHGIGLALVLRLWLVVTGNVVVALLTVAAVMAAISRGGSPDILLKYWIPHSTVAGATMLATAFAGLLLRGPSWLPLLAVGAVLLINAHVGFVLIVPALVIAVALTAIMAGRLPFAVFDGAATLRYAAMHREPDCAQRRHHGARTHSHRHQPDRKLAGGPADISCDRPQPAIDQPARPLADHRPVRAALRCLDAGVPALGPAGIGKPHGSRSASSALPCSAARSSSRSSCHCAGSTGTTFATCSTG